MIDDELKGAIERYKKYKANGFAGDPYHYDDALLCVDAMLISDAYLAKENDMTPLTSKQKIELIRQRNLVEQEKALLYERAPNHIIHDDVTFLLGEIDRLRNGKNWTEEEVHDICHNLPSVVPLCQFAEGCAKQQINLYGSAPDREDAEKWRHMQDLKDSAAAADEDMDRIPY